MSCLFDNFEVVSMDVMIRTYPLIICNFLKIYKIPYAEYNNVIYTPVGITEEKLKNVCECKHYLFELNLLYYIYQANECLLFKGKIRNEVLSSSQKKIIVSISTSGDLTNVNLNQKQSTSTTVEMVNVNDPSVQNSMQGIYLQSLMGVIKAFGDRGVPKLVQFKDPELEEKIFDLSGYKKVSAETMDQSGNLFAKANPLGFLKYFSKAPGVPSEQATDKAEIEKQIKTEQGKAYAEAAVQFKDVVKGVFTGSTYMFDPNSLEGDDEDKFSNSSYEYMEKAFDKQIHEDLEIILGTMVMNQQMILLKLDEVDARRYNINIDQESIQKIMIEQVSDGLLDKFFENIFIKSNKYNCKVNTYPVENNTFKSENKVVFYLIISFIILLVFGIIGLVLYYYLR